MAGRVVLTGQHVVLEPMTAAAVPALCAAAGEGRDSYGYTRVPADEAATAEYVQHPLEDEAAGTALPFVTRLRADGRVVGSTRFLDLDHWGAEPGWPPGVRRRSPDDRPEVTGEGPLPSVAEIGSTWPAPTAQRTPVNTEAKLLMLRHAFDRWGVHRVSFKTDARNARSRAAIERLGAVFEGVRRAHVPAVDGTIRDSAYYSIISAEWPGVRERLEARPASSVQAG